MIKKVDLSSENEFLNLGLFLNDNFANLYCLDKIISSLFEEVIGFYYDNKLLGFIHITKSFENIDIVNIVTDIKYRRRGIASSLINYVVDNNPDCKNIFLEVREDNDMAIDLYKKENFKVINRRKKYYGDVDALVMERKI